MYQQHVALAARYAQEKYGIGKVLIVDWDVHHGNGTQDIFYEDESVFFMSSHQYPWYPGTGSAVETGKGKGFGKHLNFPLPAGTGKKEIVHDAFGEELQKNGFIPTELILISAGFDSRLGDPLRTIYPDGRGLRRSDQNRLRNRKSTCGR